MADILLVFSTEAEREVMLYDIVMASAGIRLDNLTALVAESGVTEVPALHQQPKF
ncbi:hypothetical protein [Undibacterium sp. TS12]|uniref:hypothetical protein n=1 Tax=Undibacterium sp. TS12 TaxID=2908202 RepID=UPI001F4CA52A|nr:hypothetical protein [Undibacterium sp. TS12]MCH8618511.1 hypothetical protein [Undibacterium sp. TS12]